ncbi:hypothetical protein HYS31_02370 [Candidatus Woesearchaeota archaeon]|nr:hypothetical protein [Candidatus Woesearchaeota archaeon]
MAGHKKKGARLLMLLLAVIAIAMAFYFGPSLTGFVIREFYHADEVNLVITSSGNYTWKLENEGSLKSLKIDGSVTIYGKAKVYLESNGIKYLVLDSSQFVNKTAKDSSALQISGFAVKEDSKEKDKNESDEDNKIKNNKPKWSSEQDEFEVNGTAAINLSLHFSDKDNDALVYFADEAEGLNVSVANEIAVLVNENGNDFNTTIAFIASDGIDSTSRVVRLIVLKVPSEEPANETNLTEKKNNAPQWNSDTDYFVLNKTLAINLLDYFLDLDNDQLSFSVSDAENINESFNGSILALSTEAYDFNTTLNITASDNKSSFGKEIRIIVLAYIANATIISNETLEQNKTMSISLSYGSGTIYDVNDNGEETINGVVDLTVGQTSFNWDVEKSRLCTFWRVQSIDDAKLTKFCNGNSQCCAFGELLPTEDLWNDTYYSAFGKDGAGYDNAVYARVAYYNVNLSPDNLKSEIYLSEWANLSVKYYKDEIEFADACAETCSLEGLNRSSYTLVFEIEGDAVLKIGRLHYSIDSEAQNNAPILLKNISVVNVTKGRNATINLSEYFSDADNDRLKYSYYEPDNITIYFENNTATIAPDMDFEGIAFSYIIANDSEKFVISDVFLINITPKKLNAPTINLTFGSFEIIGNARLAVIDGFGNLNIKGTLIQNSEVSADENDFAIQNNSGLATAAIKNPEGNLILRGILTEGLGSLNATESSFIIQDKNNVTIAYFNSTGSLFLKGIITQNVAFE